MALLVPADYPERLARFNALRRSEWKVLAYEVIVVALLEASAAYLMPRYLFLMGIVLLLPLVLIVEVWKRVEVERWM